VDTAGEYRELVLIPFGRELLEEASPWEGFRGLLNHELASANLAIFDTPLDLVVGLEARRFANGLRKGHPVFLVNDGRSHAGNIHREGPRFKHF
jgi:hypothetical protein